MPGERASALATGRSPATRAAGEGTAWNETFPSSKAPTSASASSPASAPRRSRSVSNGTGASPFSAHQHPLHRRAVDLARRPPLVAAQQRVAEAPQHEQVEVLLARDPVLSRRVVDERVDALGPRRPPARRGNRVADVGQPVTAGRGGEVGEPHRLVGVAQQVVDEHRLRRGGERVHVVADHAAVERRAVGLLDAVEQREQPARPLRALARVVEPARVPLAPPRAASGAGGRRGGRCRRRRRSRRRRGASGRRPAPPRAPARPTTRTARARSRSRTRRARRRSERGRRRPRTAGCRARRRPPSRAPPRSRWPRGRRRPRSPRGWRPRCPPGSRPRRTRAPAPARCRGSGGVSPCSAATVAKTEGRAWANGRFA